MQRNPVEKREEGNASGDTFATFYSFISTEKYVPKSRAKTVA
jgi:hypothetical protein